jgi:phospholipase/carboxylesterase
MQFVNRFVPGVGAVARTLVLLHGTGGDENSLLDLGPILDPDANMLGVRGRSNEEGVNRFFRRFREGLFDEADILSEAYDLAEFLVEAKSAYAFTGEVTLVGYSNGANMGAALMLLHPSSADSAVLFRGMLPLLPPSIPSLTGKRLFLSSGDRDPMAPFESATRLAQMFTEYGAEVERQVTAAGHGIGREDVNAAREWLQLH